MSENKWYAKIIFTSEGVEHYEVFDTEMEANIFVSGFNYAKAISEQGEGDLDDYTTAVDQLKPRDE